MSTTGLFTTRNEPRYLLNISLGGPNAGLGLCKRDKAPASTGIRITDRTGHTLAYRSITLYRLPIVLVQKSFMFVPFYTLLKYNEIYFK